MTREQMREHATAAVADWPPPTREQLDKLAQIFRASTAGKAWRGASGPRSAGLGSAGTAGPGAVRRVVAGPGMARQAQKKAPTSGATDDGATYLNNHSGV